MDRRLIVGVGYVGRLLGTAWSRAGADVYGTTRRRERFTELRSLGLKPVRWDVLGADNDSLPEVDDVVYCVGHDRSAGASVHSVYVDGLRRTLERLPNPTRFLYVSSTGVYGDAGGDWVDEKTPPQPIDPTGQACLDAERLLGGTCTDRGIHWSILRLAGIYGPGRMIGVEALRAGRPVAGNPDGHLNLIHVADVVHALDCARTHSTCADTYNVSDGRPVVRREFYQYVADQFGAPAPMFDVGAARRIRGDRKIRNDKMIRELGVRLQFPDYRSGLAASME
jgi:nucleoside-diphosphate-sugar epimerase